MKKIRLTQGYYAKVDDEDFKQLSQYRWQYHLGYAKRGSYVPEKKNNASVKMHRQIMVCPKGMVVHHRNHDRLDNRRKNLVVCKPSDNLRSQRQKKSVGKYTSKHQGVYKRNNGSYRGNPLGFTAKIKIDYKNVYLGTFPTEDEAGLAYNIAAKEAFGEFAILNNIPKGLTIPNKEQRVLKAIGNLTSTKAIGMVQESSLEKYIKTKDKSRRRDVTRVV